jgi:maltooligosyltrehalose trehalohydrolase
MHKSRGHQTDRRLPIGAEVLVDGQVSFRVWAPKPRRIHLVLDGGGSAKPEELRLQAEGDGYCSLLTDRAQPGMRYGFRLDQAERIRPDPASRFQPDDPGGLSQIVDPRTFQWTDHDWKGIGPLGQVVYEMHLGTFTREGTYESATAEFAELARIGITVIEIMPVADFPGQFGWGYDGVCMFAPCRLYGQPDDLRRFVDQAHAAGLGVVLDVVYNHFGNVDNYLGEFSDNFRSNRYKNEWAEAINFDDDRSQPVRDFFKANARYWIEEFHLDGYRYDATHAIHDASSEHILAAVNREARTAAGNRCVYLVAENEAEEARMIRPAKLGGYDMDAAWNDDFHHAAHVRLTGTNPAYYSDYFGSVEELAAAIKHGFIYQGQRSQWQNKRRGSPTAGLPATAFVHFLENHDQTSNSATGQRLHQLTSPGRYRAMTALWLLSPQTPLFFQGQEFAASSPFLYFADFSGDMAKAVQRGRSEFLSQFPTLSTEAARRMLANPCDRATFQRCKLDFSERKRNEALYNLHIDLLKLRRDDPIFRQQNTQQLETAALSPDCLAVRYDDATDGPRLILTNFGGDLHLHALPQPLLAPPAMQIWKLIFSSNSKTYGGPGIASIEIDGGWIIPGEATVVFDTTSASENEVRLIKELS